MRKKLLLGLAGGLIDAKEMTAAGRRPPTGVAVSDESDWRLAVVDGLEIIAERCWRGASRCAM